MKDEKPLDPWVVVAPDGLRWIGLAKNEHHAWQFALGWPDQKEIADTKAIGWYAVKGNLTWSKRRVLVLHWAKMGGSMKEDFFVGLVVSFLAGVLVGIIALLMKGMV